MKRIALIGGDGVGSDVVDVGADVLDALREAWGIELSWERFDLCAERYLRDGVTFPAAERDRIRAEFDAVLLGALGDPRVPDHRHAADILFGMRFGFDLYANVRPVRCLSPRLFPLNTASAEDVDIVFFRENTEGLYANIGGTSREGSPHEVATTQALYTRRGVERIIRAAFDFATREGRSKVTLVDKHNAMPHAHGLWKRVFEEVCAEYPGLESDHLFVDAACLFLVSDPTRFDVVVTCNLFGDILTDLGAALQGGMGMAASANLHPGSDRGDGGEGPPLFEPVHGSAPDLAGQDRANPFATILTIGMMVSYFGHAEAERRLTQLVREALDARECTADVGGELGTRAAGAAIVRRILAAT